MLEDLEMYDQEQLKDYDLPQFLEEEDSINKNTRDQFNQNSSRNPSMMQRERNAKNHSDVSDFTKEMKAINIYDKFHMITQRPVKAINFNQQEKLKSNFGIKMGQRK